MTSSETSEQFWHRLGTGVVLVMWLALFWPVLTGVSEFGFRDSASLYQPLFEWTRDQWLAGQIPLWCPLDNWGSPVVADATSSVFYPGKLIFLFSFIPFSILFGWFTSSHVLLAVFGARWCAKQFGLSPPAQWLSAVAFGFGGSVLFQTCNVVFLVGAAWLPWALGCVWEFSQTGKWMDVVRLALALTMMVLGGDPQMAFHVTMIAAIWWITMVLINSRRAETGISWRRALTGLLAAVLLASALSAIQILPSIEWAQTSERTAIRGDASFDDIFDRPIPGTHRDAVYQFSLPPWNVVEMVWPNILGKLNFATNWRWSSSIAGADRMWTGSLYSGSIIFLLALTVIMRGRKERSDYLLIGMLVVFMLGSFGWYGIGWMINELQMMRGGGPLIGEPTGGVYWWMELAIPGYASFRYPAKLFVIAALAICLLGGRGFDQLQQQRQESVGGSTFGRQCFKAIMAVIVMSVLAALAMALSSVPGVSFFALSASDSREILWSLGRTIVLLTLFAGLIYFQDRKTLGRNSFRQLAFLLCVIELIVAVAWTICLVPVSKSNRVKPTGDIETIFRPPDLNDIRYYEGWDELPVQLDIDRQTLLPKHHLLTGQRLIGSFSSIEPRVVAKLLEMLNDDFEVEQRDRILAMLGVDSRLEFGEANRDSNEKAAFKQLAGRGRFYFANELQRSNPWKISDNEKGVWNRWIEFARGKRAYQVELAATWWFVRKYSQERYAQRLLVSVECDEALVANMDSPLQDNPTIECIEDGNNRIRLRLSSGGKHLLVVTDYFDKNWQAWQLNENGSRTRLPMVRVNRVHRGIVTPAGNYDIEMVYRPVWFYRGAWISCLAWLTSVGWWLRVRRRR